MIKLNRAELRDKIYACWLGKNIGGTLGTPFEGRQQVNDIKGFNSAPGNPLPNDDLDLQLIWLKAMREVGPQKLDAKILGEYWIDYISPFWNEYGIGKSNINHGLVPPMSGEYKNEWKHSNGAWIRTEIWASIYPADIEKAIYFAYQDACVDHGMGEGTYAAIFVAALESAAFVISDIRELINIGLSKIPETCRFYNFIVKACELFDEGKTWQEAREIITNMSLEDEELGWFQAPANVAYAIIGLLYGEGDFKKSLIITVNCGDDTDCSGATAGSILGIIGGTRVIPKDWQEYIGDKIITVAVNRGAAYGLPESCTQLTDMVMECQPVTLFQRPVMVCDDATDAPEADVKAFKGSTFADMLGARSAYSAEFDFAVSHVIIEYSKAPDILPNGEIGVKLTVQKKLTSQKHYSVRWLLPEGWTVDGTSNIDASRKNPDTPVSTSYTIHANENVNSKNRAVVEITCDGRADVALVPVLLFG